jgi:FkbM family methyltransferase
MTTRFQKYWSHIRTAHLNKLRKSMWYTLTYARRVIADTPFIIIRFLILRLSNRILVKIKSSVEPKVKLDYPRSPIYLNADSELSVFRSQACAKEPETIAWIEKNIKPQDVFYDVGANVGAYSLVACQLHDGNVQVCAFEPSFSTYYQLCRNIIINNCQERIFPYLIALTEKTDLLTFHYRSVEGGSADHFLSVDSSSLPIDMMPVYKQKVFSFSLDTLVRDYGFPPPQHIKLDVDGAEYSILLGACETLKTGIIKSILVEVRTVNQQDELVVKYLASMGYQLASRHDRGDGIIWNYIFVRAE